MTQERIFLTLQKEPGKPARVVDQHGRQLAGVRGVNLVQHYLDCNVLNIEVVERGGNENKPISGTQPGAACFKP